jgi:hypothetical protein
MKNILALTCEFSSDWMETLKAATMGEIADAINGIVANRNLIAHGQSSDISYERVNDWFHKAAKGIQLIEEQCNQH